MTKDQSKNLVLITGGVVIAGTLLTHHYSTSTQHFSGEKQTFDLGKRIAAVLVLVMVMTVMADQIPDLTGPLALLILVAYISTHLGFFQQYVEDVTK